MIRPADNRMASRTTRRVGGGVLLLPLVLITFACEKRQRPDGRRAPASPTQFESAGALSSRSRGGRSAPPIAILIDTSGSMKDPVPGDSRPKGRRRAARRSRAMLDATDAFVAQAAGLSDQDRHLRLFQQRLDAAAAQPYDRAAVRDALTRAAAALAAARPSARPCARRGPTCIAPACSANTCWSSPTARTRSAAAPDDVARDIFRKSEGAVQIYFVAFDTSPDEVRVPQRRRRRRHQRRQRRRSSGRRSTDLPGQDSRRGDRAGEREPGSKSIECQTRQDLLSAFESGTERNGDP